LTAATLQNAAYVSVLWQVDLLFTFALSITFFHERASMLEVDRLLLVAAGRILLLLGQWLSPFNQTNHYAALQHSCCDTACERFCFTLLHKHVTVSG
jgi:hypothetical protein